MYVCAGVVSQHLRAFYFITAVTEDPQGVFMCVPVSGEYLITGVDYSSKKCVTASFPGEPDRHEISVSFAL